MNYLIEYNYICLILEKIVNRSNVFKNAIIYCYYIRSIISYYSLFVIRYRSNKHMLQPLSFDFRLFITFVAV